ncbi:MAG: serine/threonine-protein kinase [Candidatus Micrarchaeia archaeon]
MQDPKGPPKSKVDPTLVRDRQKEDFEKFHGREADQLIGKTLSSRYKILEKIGEGGMGKVYLAEDTRIGKKVAVKVLPEYLGKTGQIAERFIQEAKVAPRIEHENIIDVTDLGKTPKGVPFFVMEYLKGSDLGSAMSKGEVRGWNVWSKDLLLQICRALSAAHDKGIVHRDMKPENVFLVERSDKRVFVKLVDFGIAKLLEQAQDEPSEAPSGGEERPGRITQAGSIMGTPEYMAPEQASGEDVDHRVDIYAVGTMVYEIACGKVPFEVEEKESPMADALKILHMQKFTAPQPPSARRPDLKIPAGLEAVIMKALAKKRDDRFATMKEMETAIEALEATQEERKPIPLTKGITIGSRAGLGYNELIRRERSRKRLRIAIIAAGLIAAAAGLTVAGELARFHGEQGIDHHSDAGKEGR